MSSLKKYFEISRSCDSILYSKFSSITTFSIPWLFIIREHPDDLANYKNIYNNKKLSYLLFFFKYIKKIIIITYRLIIKINFSTKYFYNNSKLKKTDYIFVSTLVNKQYLNKEDDFYFKDIKKTISNDKNLIFSLINQQNLKINKSDLINKDKLVFKNDLFFTYEIKIFLIALSESAKLFIRSIFNRGLRKNILLQASLEALSSSTISSIRLNIQFEKLIKQVNPKVIILTYEGYAWERLCFFTSKKFNKNIRCIGYQHTRLFNNQHSIFRCFNNDFDPDIILTSGEIPTKIFKKKINSKKISIINIGKLDYDLHIEKKNDQSINTKNKEICLVVPEGNLNENILLIKFIFNIIRFNKKYIFLLRFHPIVNLNYLQKKFNFISNLNDNIIISSDTLYADLCNSKYVLYRGSSVIFSAVKYGLVPIYLKNVDEISINPLNEILDNEINSAEYKLFENKLSQIKSKMSINDDTSAFVNKYFNEFNYKNFKLILEDNFNIYD